jgi:hypothetical protein
VLRILTILGIALAAIVPATAEARVFVGVGVGVYGPPAYYYPPPAYYYPPPPAYYYSPAPVYVAPPAPASNVQCREYQGNATIDGSEQPFYGRACLQPDGRWHIVN